MINTKKEDEKIIEVNNLVKKFKTVTAVDGISFHVNRGEIFGFLGPNGAGKSTTINIICTLMHQTSGTVKLSGFDTLKDRYHVRNCIGLVFQDPSLDDKLTALENLNFHAMLYNVPKVTKAKRIQEVLEMVNLDNRKKDLVSTFSGGMKRRLEIARGLIHYPKVLFLDEPTLGLDPQTRNKIWTYILDLKKTHDITIFLTTHYMEETENCDRIAIIDKGKIIALDTPDNLKRQIGETIITIGSENNPELKKYIENKYNFKVDETKENTLKFEVKGSSSKFVPEFIKECPIEIISISTKKPTLEDVFLSFTGREIREESPDRKAAFGMRGRMHR